MICVMPIPEARIPARIHQHDGRTLAIDWSDGSSSLMDVRAMRLACGCAECVDEWSGEPLLAPESVPEDVAPISISPVGRYAIRIEWSDGHSAGIYPFDRLRKLADQGLLVASDVTTARRPPPGKPTATRSGPGAHGDGSPA
jgi:ATP-binding protein involved in chromosome partitioning